MPHEPERNPYDAYPYPGRVYPQTHPQRLAAIGRLFRLDAAPVARCRVLELGCGDGVNLVAMAYALPESSFLGIDLAAGAIRRARELALAAGVSNVTFLCQDVGAAAADLGEFDYIIAHGLFSWVPREAQQAILALLGARLAAHGIAYISYNVAPGGLLRGVVRRILLFHTRGVAEPAERLHRARALLRLLPSHPLAIEEYRVLMAAEAEELSQRPDAVMLHDTLEETNEPVWLADLAARAAACGLQYLGDADYSSMCMPGPPEPPEAMAGWDDPTVRHEQYQDIFTGRGFRRSLFCRAAVPLSRDVPPQRLFDLRFVTLLEHAAPAPDLTPGVKAEFRHVDGRTLTTDFQSGKAALAELAAAWPDSLSFDELAAGGDDALRDALAQFLMRLAGANMVELASHRFAFARQPGPLPRASRLVRVEAARGAQVSSLRHTRIDLEDTRSRAIVQLLDGTRGRAELAEHFGVTLDEIEAVLTSLARLALLEA